MPGPNFMVKDKLTILQKFNYPKSLIKEYRHWYLISRNEQITLNSLILLCKDDAENYSKISKESFEEFPHIVKEIEDTLKTLDKYQKINYIMLMMVDNCVHYHVIPRYNEKTIFNEHEFFDYSWPGPPNFSKYNNITDILYNRLTERLRNAFKCKNSCKKYNVIYTTGVFDLFHHGHLNILKESKELCDYLIVGVSTDELALKVKNKNPIIPFQERSEIIKAIKYVNQVIPQTNKNKQDVVDKYNVNAITVGDDWVGKYPSVTCELIYISYTNGISSTLARKKSGL